MLKSMTGFGRCEINDGQRKITVEIRSVNHRYLDLNIKMPKKFIAFEAEIRQVIKTYAERGKIDLFITYEDFTKSDVHLKYNNGLAAEYIEKFNEISKNFNLEFDIRTSTVSRCPEVITMEETEEDEEIIRELVLKAVSGACEKFVEARIKEGENLKTDLISKLDNMLVNVDFITERSPQIVSEYREKLIDKINELTDNIQIDESRIAMEVTIFADKSCVDEELIRLKSHITTMRECLISGGSVGRKLDFIAQEMNREANTTLSKSNDLSISNAAIELKTEIEKVREQIQNIE